jgi:hypothetical protein
MFVDDVNALIRACCSPDIHRRLLMDNPGILVRSAYGGFLDRSLAFALDKMQ